MDRGRREDTSYRQLTGEERRTLRSYSHVKTDQQGDAWNIFSDSVVFVLMISDREDKLLFEIKLKLNINIKQLNINRQGIQTKIILLPL